MMVAFVIVTAVIGAHAVNVAVDDAGRCACVVVNGEQIIVVVRKRCGGCSCRFQ